MKKILLVLIACGLILCPPSAPYAAWADTTKPGFNLFTVEQDIEIGRQSAVEAERQLPLVNDPSVDGYLNRIVQELAAGAPGARYPYEIRVVNASEINSFSLPGGFIYVSRGLFEASRSEAELAGVLAHEMGHLALRHGSHQASKAYLGQAGISLLGGLGKDGGNTSQIVNAIGGVGLNATFLKFSRDDEYQADDLGAEIMACAGYDPVAMANFFELLRGQQGRNPGALMRFFGDHPPSADREARIRQQARSPGPVESREAGGFERMRATLQSLPPASSRQTHRREKARNEESRVTRQVDLRVEPPSSHFKRFDQRDSFFSIEHPDNWRSYASGQGYAVTIAPEGGVVDNTGNGQQNVVYGVMVNHYDPFELSAARRRDGLELEDAHEGTASLEEATDDLVRQIIRSNPYLRALGDSRQRERIDGAPTLALVLSGPSPVTGEEERVTVFTRSLPDDHVLYALCIAPSRDYDPLAQIFSRMVRSLRVNDEAAHR